MQSIPGITSQVQSRCDFVMRTLFKGALPETVEEIDRLAEALRSLTDKDHLHTVTDRFAESISAIQYFINNPGILSSNPDDQIAFRSIAIAKIVAKITELSVLNPARKAAYIVSERNRIQAEADLQRQLIMPSNRFDYSDVFHNRSSDIRLIDEYGQFLKSLSDVKIPEPESTHELPKTVYLKPYEFEGKVEFYCEVLQDEPSLPLNPQSTYKIP